MTTDRSYAASKHIGQTGFLLHYYRRVGGRPAGSAFDPRLFRQLYYGIPTGRSISVGRCILCMAKATETRERILAEATRLANTRGFGATSIRDLLDAVGLKKGSLYFHFPSKQELGLAVLKRAREQSEKFRRDALQGETPQAGLHRFLDAALAAHRQKGFAGGCLWGNTALEMSDVNPDYAAFVAEVFEDWVSDLRQVIAEGQAEGAFRTDLPPDQMARHIVATMEGGIMLSRLYKQETPLKQCVDMLKTFVQAGPEPANN